MSSTAPLLTVDDLKRQQEDRQAIDDELRALEEHRQLLLKRAANSDAWLEAVRVILAANGNKDFPGELAQPAQRVVSVRQRDRTPAEISQKPLTETIMQIEDLKNGLTSGEVIAHLRRDQGAISHISNLSKQVYTNLARLKDRGQLVKQGDRYFLPPKQNEPSDLRSEGSDSGPVNGSTPSLDFSPARTVQ